MFQELLPEDFPHKDLVLAQTLLSDKIIPPSDII